MKWFYNLKIAKKLILAFIVVLTLTTILGMFSIRQLMKVNQASTDISTNWLPAIRTLLDMKVSISRIRGAQFQRLLPSGGADPAAAAEVLQRVDVEQRRGPGGALPGRGALAPQARRFSLSRFNQVRASRSLRAGRPRSQQFA